MTHRHFSLEENQFDAKEMQHYKDVIQCCKDNGITPVVTLMHFSSPAFSVTPGRFTARKARKTTLPAQS